MAPRPANRGRSFAAGLAAAVALLVFAPVAARAQSCSATVSNLNFGPISVRAGAVNQTSGSVTVSCSGVLTSLIGVCLRFGPGSGGAGAGNAPRYMRRADGAALAYQLRPSSTGAGTLNEIYTTVPVVLGSGSTTVPIYADIVSETVSVGTGTYRSLFSGTGDISLTHGILSCDLLGTTVPVPDFSVSGDVVASCEIDAGTLDFGEVPAVLNRPIDAQGTINVRCTEATSYTITLGPGSGPGVTDPANRLLRSLTGQLRYGLYRDAARSAPWGDTAGTGVSASGTGFNQAFGVHGRIHSGQQATFGTYTDSVMVTVTY